MTRARMLRIGEVCRRLGCCRSTLYANYIRPGRLRMYALGTRTVGALEADVERLVGEMVAKGSIDYSAPLHARRVGARKPDALVHDGAGRLVGYAWKVSI
jgi:predicted DNA-binding transcriptional regulator AlpA